MPDPTTVWAARLGDHRGEARGTLSLEPETLEFRHAKGQRDASIPLRSIRSVRRGFGSPVVVVHWVEEDEMRGMAFFFAQPPPLENPEGERRRTHRRRSAQYLMHENAIKRGTIKEWRRAIRAAAAAAATQPEEP